MNFKAISTTFLLSAGIILSSCSGTSETESNPTETEVKEVITEPLVKTESRAVDPKNSTIKWTGEMLGIYSHHGTVDFAESYITTEDGELASGGFIVNLTTITATDDNFNPEEGKTKEKLIGHLSSPDFFDVANYPKASFDIIEVMDGKVKGKLTIRGNTHEEVVENVVVEKMEDKIHITGVLTFDRKKYDVAFEHPMKDMVLSNDIVLNIDITTIPYIEE